jgi:predicted permease
MGNQQTGFTIEGRAAEPNVGEFGTDFSTVTPGYLDAIGIPLVRGRGFVDTDLAEAPRVVIVNEALASRACPGENPVGKVIRFGSRDGNGAPATVIGVARDAKYRSIGEAETYSMLYVPLRQLSSTRMTVLVRSASAGGPTSAMLGQVVKDLDPNLPMAANTPYREILALSLLPNRIAVLVAGLFGATGLVLATVGLYGVLSYMVQRRRREIGIRMALGAGGPAVRHLVLRDGLRLTGVGLVVGLLAALAVTRLLGSLLYGLSPVDPVTYGGIILMMLGTAWLACAGPIRRALRTEPLEVLRHD